MSADRPTREEKLAAIRNEKGCAWGFAFKVPPVPHALWNPDDWIRYIDKCGKWYPKHVGLVAGAYEEA